MAHKKRVTIGTELCRDVFNYANSKGYAAVSVATQSKQPAVEFYRHFGQKFEHVYGKYKESDGYEGQSEVVTFRWILKSNREEPGFTSGVPGTLNVVDEEVIEKICKKATEIMEIGRTPRCAVIVMHSGKKHLMAFSPKEEPRLDFLQDHELTYCIGSLSKILVATAAIILIDQMRPTLGKEKLQIAWHDTILKHLGVQLRSEGSEPTISQLLDHTSGIPSLNDFIFGPDGTVLLSMGSFVSMVEKISQEVNSRTPTKDYGWRYNNGGFILAGLLIKTYSGCTLEEYLKRTILEPLGMKNTFVSKKDYKKRRSSKKAGAHVVSAAGHPRNITESSYFDDTALAATGIYSCTNDLAIFFEALLSDENTKSPLSVNTAIRLFHPRHVFDDEHNSSCSYGGLSTSIGSIRLGSYSLNRTIDPSNTYTMPMPNDNIKVLYNAGTVRGFASSFYILPDHKTFIIALSNATGLVDVSDHISRLILQELSIHRSLESQDEYPSAEVDVVAIAECGADKMRQEMSATVRSRRCEKLSLPAIKPGLYVSQFQSLLVKHCARNTLTVSIVGDRGKSSRKYRLIQVSDDQATLGPKDGEDSTVFGVDIFHDWADVTMEIKRDCSGIITSLVRRTHDMEVSYVPESSQKTSLRTLLRG